MACCAFAVLLVSQILAALATLRRFLPGRLRGGARVTTQIDPVTAWQLHPVPAGAAPAPVSVRRTPLRLRRPLLLALGLELAIAGAAVAGLVSSREQHTGPAVVTQAAAIIGIDPTFFCRSTPAAGQTGETR